MKGLKIGVKMKISFLVLLFTSVIVCDTENEDKFKIWDTVPKNGDKFQISNPLHSGFISRISRQFSRMSMSMQSSRSSIGSSALDASSKSPNQIVESIMKPNPFKLLNIEDYKLVYALEKYNRNETSLKNEGRYGD